MTRLCWGGHGGLGVLGSCHPLAVVLVGPGVSGPGRRVVWALGLLVSDARLRAGGFQCTGGLRVSGGVVWVGWGRGGAGVPWEGVGGLRLVSSVVYVLGVV